MSHGGSRVNAGRKAGSVTVRTREVANAVALSGMTPLEYLTSIYQDVGADEAARRDAAKAAAPYVHARLNAIELAGKDGKAIGIAVFKGLNDNG